MIAAWKGGADGQGHKEKRPSKIARSANEALEGTGAVCYKHRGVHGSLKVIRVGRDESPSPCPWYIIVQRRKSMLNITKVLFAAAGIAGIASVVVTLLAKREERQK